MMPLTTFEKSERDKTWAPSWKQLPDALPKNAP
jgi:hypothetical protein